MPNCSFLNCGRPAAIRGLCRGHVAQLGRWAAESPDNAERLATSVEHADADRRCGREWVCQCGACRLVRKALRPLRGPRGQIGAEPLKRIPGLRVSPACYDAVTADPPGAREALEAWSRQPRPAPRPPPHRCRLGHSSHPTSPNCPCDADCKCRREDQP